MKDKFWVKIICYSCREYELENLDFEAMVGFLEHVGQKEIDGEAYCPKCVEKIRIENGIHSCNENPSYRTLSILNNEREKIKLKLQVANKEEKEHLMQTLEAYEFVIGETIPMIVQNEPFEDENGQLLIVENSKLTVYNKDLRRI